MSFNNFPAHNSSAFNSSGSQYVLPFLSPSLLCVRMRRIYSLHPLLAFLKMRAPKSFSMSDVRPMLTPSSHSSWVPILPRTFEAIPPPLLLSDDRPSNLVGLRPHYGARYGQALPTPAILPLLAPEAVPEGTDAVEAERPAKRQRLLAAAPAMDGRRVESPAPVPIQRVARAHVRTSSRPIRTPQACQRCR